MKSEFIEKEKSTSDACVLTIKIVAFLIVAITCSLVIDHYISDAAKNDELTAVLVISKVLGTLMAFGGSLKEIPQLAKIFEAGSVKGLSRASLYIDLLMQMHLSAYCLRHKVPFNVYGESITLMGVNLVYAGFHWAYSEVSKPEKVFSTIFFSLYGFLLFEGSFTKIGNEELTWALILDTTTFLNIFAKVP